MRSLVSVSLLVLLMGPVLAEDMPPAPDSSQPAAAQSPGSDAPRSGHKGRQSVTKQDFVARGEAALMRADTDGDGRVSRAEWMAYAAARGMKGRPERQFARLDLNRDGVLDKSEIDAMLARRFAKRDTNADGLLTADERHPRSASRP